MEVLFDDSARNVAGYGPLRQAIADYLQVSRAVRCRPEQVMVVSGSQQALFLLAHLLLDPGDQVWIDVDVQSGEVLATDALLEAIIQYAEKLTPSSTL